MGKVMVKIFCDDENILELQHGYSTCGQKPINSVTILLLNCHFKMENCEIYALYLN